MKKAFLAILLFAGFILVISESDTFVPNVLGLIMCCISAYNLKVFQA